MINKSTNEVTNSINLTLPSNVVSNCFKHQNVEGADCCKQKISEVTDKCSQGVDIKTERCKLQTRLDRLYSCRDLEISNLWQRSLFLSSFIILAFSAYGFLIYQAVISETISKTYHLAFMALCSISSFMSFMWLLMNKASKAWYEVYEYGICKYEEKYSEELNIDEAFMMGEILNPCAKLNSLGFKGGRYSPSKINIAISLYSFYLWIGLLIVHSLLALDILNRNQFIDNNKIFYILTPLLSIFALYFFYNNVKSSFIK